MNLRRATTTSATTVAAALALAACAQMPPDKATSGAPPASAAVTPAAPVPAAPPVAAAPPAPESAAPAEPSLVVKETRAQPEEVERLLSYFERLKRLPAAELTREHEAARLAHGRSASDFNRISYAMTLSLPGTAFNDDARALELLNPLVKKGENGQRSLVVLLTTFIQERRRLGGDLAAVQQKLDALKSLERKLLDRDQNNLGRK